MPITIHPRPGQILKCDFSEGFKEPEIVKRRPVVVLASFDTRPGLVTVACLSTQEPDPPRDYHMEMQKGMLPQLGEFQKDTTWLKGDMVYTVGFHRLDRIRLGKKDPLTGKRVYFTQRLSRETMKSVYTCVLHGLKIGHISRHL